MSRVFCTKCRGDHWTEVYTAAQVDALLRQRTEEIVEHLRDQMDVVAKERPSAMHEINIVRAVADDIEREFGVKP